MHSRMEEDVASFAASPTNLVGKSFKRGTVIVNSYPKQKGRRVWPFQVQKLGDPKNLVQSEGYSSPQQPKYGKFENTKSLLGVYH